MTRQDVNPMSESPASTPTTDFSIRKAGPADLNAINDIYNYFVTRSSCTFQTDCSAGDERREWFSRHGPEYPVIVAEEQGAVIGWASLSPYHSRCGYRFTVEDSVYVRADCHGRGIGRALLTDLVRRATEIGHHSIIAMIAGDQPASVGLHAKQGFVQVAHLREVGYKFERWIDVIFMQRMLGQA